MKKKRLFLPLLMALLVAICYPLMPEKTPTSVEGALLVSFLDVGQGDSTFIEFPSGKTALIDAGEEEYAQTVISYIKERGYTKVDYIICTHPHSDHIGGMARVVDAFSVGEVYMPRVSHTTKTYEGLLTTIKNKNLSVHAARAGTAINPEENVAMTFVAPCSDTYDELNDYSAVIRLTYADTAFLFTGDAEALAENEMLASGSPMQADVLKVGHHGSNTSSQKRFLETVAPHWAVISVGRDNDYGHPTEKVLSRLRATGANIIRTDEVGTITFISDGNTIEPGGTTHVRNH